MRWPSVTQAPKPSRTEEAQPQESIAPGGSLSPAPLPRGCEASGGAGRCSPAEKAYGVSPDAAQNPIKAQPFGQVVLCI